MLKKYTPTIAEMAKELKRQKMWLSSARAKSSKTAFRNHDGEYCENQSNNGIIPERRQLVKTLAHTQNDDAAIEIGYRIACCEPRNKCRHLLCCFCRGDLQEDYRGRMDAFAATCDPSKVYRLTVILAAWDRKEISAAENKETPRPGGMIFDEWSSFKRRFRDWMKKSLPKTKVVLVAELEWHRVEDNSRSKINQTLTKMGYAVDAECMILHAHGIVVFDTGIDPKKRQRVDNYLQLRVREVLEAKHIEVSEKIPHLTRWDTRSEETPKQHTLSRWMRYALKGRISKAKDNWRGDEGGRARFFDTDASGQLIWKVQADWATVEMAKVYALMPGSKRLVLRIGKL